MVRPEQLVLGEADAAAVPSVVRSYEYFGHDAVVRVQPDDGGLPELVVRITGGHPARPGDPGRGAGARRRGGVARDGRDGPPGAGNSPNHACVTTSLWSSLSYHGVPKREHRRCDG